MPILKNFFRKVRAAVEELSFDKDEAIRQGSEEISGLMMTALRLYAPDGSRNLDQYDGSFGDKQFHSRLGERPSARMGLIPIRDSFITGFGLSIVNKNVAEGRISIDTVSRHATYFTKGLPEVWEGGTRRHFVPKSGFQAKKGYPLTFHYNGENRAVWTWTVPSGIKLEKHGDYVKDAWNSIEDEAESIMENATHGAIRRMFGRFRQ